MRQVPAVGAASFGIVGDARLARHVQHYLTQLQLPFRAWSRRASAATPPEALADCDTILMLPEDAAIVPFVESWSAPRKKRLVHCSGSVVADLVEGAHPLMTFGGELYDLPTYRSPSIRTRSRAHAIRRAASRSSEPMVHASGRRSSLLPRAFCHGRQLLDAAVLFDELQQRWSIPSSAARPYLSRVMVAQGASAFTGPFLRGDVGTITANLRALEGGAVHDVCRAFARTYDQRA